MTLIDPQRPMIQQEIANAVLAERERCAKIAEAYDVEYADKEYCDNFCGEDIARKIRKGE